MKVGLFRAPAVVPRFNGGFQRLKQPGACDRALRWFLIAIVMHVPPFPGGELRPTYGRSNVFGEISITV